MLEHLKARGGTIKDLFNTSGIQYRELKIAEQFKAGLSDSKALNLLSENGKLVKRPFLLGEDFGLVGFKPEAWAKILPKLQKLLAIIFLFANFGCASDSGTPTPASPAAGTTSFTVVNSGASSYLMNGSANAALTLQRGQTYTFSITASGHPFYIMSVQGTNTANAYNSGVTGNGTQSGTLTFVVPAGAPNTLYYDCSVHSSMTGTITITN